MFLQVGELLSHNVTIDARRVACVTRAYVDGRPELKDVLVANGGVFKAGETWCLGLLEEMGLSRRKCTTPASKLPAN